MIETNQNSDSAANEPAPVPGELLVFDRDGVRTLTMNRPQSKNGLTLEQCAGLIAALEQAGRDEAVRVVVITGQGGAFCSGLDLKAAMAMAQSQSGTEGGAMGAAEVRMRRYFHGLIRAVRKLERPVVALVDGAAAGFGCDLALACDLRLGTERARFSELFVKRGLMPDGGSTFTLPRLVGVGRALEMMMLGDNVEAAEAHRTGLLNRVVAGDAEVAEYLGRLAAAPPLVVRAIKRTVYDAQASDLDAALEAEVRNQMVLLQSQDFVEGMTAFLTKRPPQFTGN